MNATLQELGAPLMRLWSARSPRERMVLKWAGLVLFLLLYSVLLHSGNTARRTLQTRVLSLRTEAATLEQQASELERLRALPPVPAPAQALLPQLQDALAQAGLDGLLINSAALDADHVTLAFGALPFVTWLRWIDALQATHVRVVEARIEALATPGLVSITATLARPAPP